MAQAQTNQWFADISSYYDSDTELHTEELQKVVMDAGVVGDARYILPLGYSFELLLADKARWDQEPDLADSTGVTLADLLDTGTPEWIPDWLWWGHLPLNALPQLADYDKETILVDKAQLTAMLGPMTRASQLSRERYFSPARAQSISYLSYIQAKSQCPATPFDGNNWCVHTTLEQVLAGSLPTAKCEGQELQMIPLKTADGQLVADITYWGAVSSSSENVAIAYDVLRLFLTPGVQHGTGLVYSDGTVQEIEPEDPGEDSWSPGWPVRYKGFVKAQWEREQKVLEMTYSDRPERKEALLALELDDSDLPILDEEIHYARFTGALDQELHTLLEPLQWQAASEEEIEQIADTFLRDLKYHLAEG